MKHKVDPDFWILYRALPKSIKARARRSFRLLSENPRHPSLHFKKVSDYWSARIGLDFRAVAVEVDGDMVWFWIGSHSDYDKLIR